MADQPEPEPRPFTEILAEVESGFLATDLSARLHGVVEAVRNQGKPGALSVTLKVTPISGTRDSVQISAAVREKRPEPERAPSHFFVTRSGDLSRKHPSQMTDPALGGEE